MFLKRTVGTFAFNLTLLEAISSTSNTIEKFYYSRWILWC